MEIKEKITRWVRKRISLPAAGLDLSDRSIKYVRFADAPRGLRDIASGSSRMMLAEYGTYDIPEGSIAGGVVRDENALAAAIAAASAGAGYAFRASGMVVSLPEEKSFLKVVHVPRVAPEDLAGAVRWGIEGQIPLSPDEMIYGFEEVSSAGGASDHRDVAVIAFPKDVVMPYVRAVKAAGLTPVAFELESQAIIRAALPDLESSAARIVMDMGRTRTSFVLVGGGAILFTTTIGVGGQAMELAIAQGLGVDAAEAARIKKETGLSRADYEGRLASVLMPLLAPVAAELVRTVAYYRDHGRQIASGGGGGDMVENIVLSGGDAGLYGLDTYLASETQIPVVRADPFAAIRECMDGTVPLMPYHQALAFTAAIGLALRGRACARPRTG